MVEISGFPRKDWTFSMALNLEKQLLFVSCLHYDGVGIY